MVTGTNDMVMNEVLERFVARHPVTVIARVALERALSVGVVSERYQGQGRL